MDSVVIVAPHDYDTELKLRLERDWAVTQGAGGAWVVEAGASRVYLSRDPRVRDELDPDEIESILAAIPEPIFYTLDFGDIGLCRRVLATIADDPRLLVDNDHGIRLPGSEFVRMLRSQQDWDWRRHPP